MSNGETPTLGESSRRSVAIRSSQSQLSQLTGLDIARIRELENDRGSGALPPTIRLPWRWVGRAGLRHAVSSASSAACAEAASSATGIDACHRGLAASPGSHPPVVPYSCAYAVTPRFAWRKPSSASRPSNTPAITIA
jgi:hypothetical protein